MELLDRSFSPVGDVQRTTGQSKMCFPQDRACSESLSQLQRFLRSRLSIRISTLRRLNFATCQRKVSFMPAVKIVLKPTSASAN